MEKKACITPKSCCRHRIAIHYAIQIGIFVIYIKSQAERYTSILTYLTTFLSSARVATKATFAKQQQGVLLQANLTAQ